MPARFLIFMLSVLFTVSLSARAQTPANPAYTAIDLGTLGGSYSDAYSINNSGQIVGYSYTTGDSAQHATLFNPDGTRTDLGTLGGTNSAAFAINNSGQIVGASRITGDSAEHAALFTPGGSPADLGTLSGGTDSYAYAINDSGQIAGYSINSATRFTSGGAPTDLGTLGGAYSIAYGINNSGQIAGLSSNSSSAQRATRFNTDGTRTDLGTLGGTSSDAYAINNAGQIVGDSSITGNGAVHATLFNTNGTRTDLGTLGGRTSYASGINNAGQIVGDSYITGNSATHGFLYSGGAMSDVNSLVQSGSGITDITINGYSSINDWGQIAANGTVSGQGHAVLLNPVNPLTTLTGASRDTKFVGGMSYSKFTATTHVGGLGTTVALLGGTAGSAGSVAYAQGGYGLNRDVTVAFTGADATGLASDIVNVAGTFGDTIVLSLTYDESAYGDGVLLGWLDPGDNTWKNAVLGNIGGAPIYVDGAYDPDADFHPGTYGRDAATNTVWAVVNHNSTFAAIAVAVPEPGAWAALLPALCVLGVLLRARRKLRALAALALPACAALAPPARAQTPAAPAYTAIDLGTLGGAQSFTSGIGSSGQIVGRSNPTDSSFFHATRSNPDGTLTDLGSLGGPYSYSAADGINSSGQIAGYSYLFSDNSVVHATRFNPDGTLTDLGTLGGTNSRAYGINDSGQIAGYSQISGSSAYHATRFNPDGTLADLGTLGGTDSSAYGINNAGQTVGYSYTTGDNVVHATRFNPDGTLTDLGTLGGVGSSVAYAINDSGQIAGYSSVIGSLASHATRFDPDGTLTDLGTLGGTDSSAYGINNSGQIVGYSYTTGNGAQHAFLYSGGVMSDLNSLVQPESGIANINITGIGNDINDWGQIAAYGTVGSQIHAVLLNPVDPLTILSGASRDTKFVGGMAYDKFTPTTNTRGLGTTIALLGGTAGSVGSISYADGGYGLNRDVTAVFLGTDNTGLASDIAELDGTFTDLVVISLTYDESFYGDNVQLDWLAPNDGTWKNAVLGNTGDNTPTFIDGAYDPAADFHPGTYGRDAATNTVWAVVDHTGEFAAAAVPEPGTWAALLPALCTLCAVARRRSA